MISINSRPLYFKADMQARNLLIMGEREEQLQDLIHILRTTVEKSPQVEAKLHMYQKELEGMQLCEKSHARRILPI